MEQQRRRRIDRVTSEDYLDGLGTIDVPEIRSMRDDCHEEETRLSYARRVVHGQLDIVRAEQRRRNGDSDEGLVGTLSDILADEPAAQSRQARNSPIYSPDEAGYGNRTHDTLIDDPATGRVPDLSDEELVALFDRLQEKEAHISSLRRTVLDHLDALQGELIKRYRDGSVDMNQVVAAATNPDESSR